MSIIIKQLSSEDIDEFVQLICVFEDVFAMKDFKMPDVAYLQQLLKKEDFFVFVAVSGEEVVGGLTSYVMHQYYSASPLVYIFDLAVEVDFQRKGIGKLLIEANNNYSKSINADAVMVQADIADEHAIEFYRSTGATGQKVIHFDYIFANK
ncbi:MAG: GCN5-related N-acetyltransferase [Bacteroidota bacterium]|jgi:ribosomal protein S18 acetylase RimI-like enzyme|nr:GCN5-related N-acetyltransferase [Bacteroidota bacterium]